MNASSIDVWLDAWLQTRDLDVAEFAFIMARVQNFGWEVKIVSLFVARVVSQTCNLLLRFGTTASLFTDTYLIRTWTCLKPIAAFVRTFEFVVL